MDERHETRRRNPAVASAERERSPDFGAGALDLSADDPHPTALRCGDAGHAKVIAGCVAMLLEGRLVSPLMGGYVGLPPEVLRHGSLCVMMHALEISKLRATAARFAGGRDDDEKPRRTPRFSAHPAILARLDGIPHFFHR